MKSKPVSWRVTSPRELRTKNHETLHEKAQTKHAGARGLLPVNRGDSR